MPHIQSLLGAFPANFDEQHDIPSYREIPLHFEEWNDVIDFLRNVNWAFTNDDTTFLTHDLHPYPAKFIPQLPGTCISLLSSRGEIVFDPFGGSGTTAFEAIRLGRRAISFDANPVASLIGRVKTAVADRKTIEELHALHSTLSSYISSIPYNEDTLIKKYGKFAPTIANREKWFPDSSFGELSYIKHKILALNTSVAVDIASLALSRTVLPASFQDSETRYKSVPRNIPPGETIKKYTAELEHVMKSVATSGSITRYGLSNFLTGDIKHLDTNMIPDGSIDLVVTSPPYGNAMDYHLYHRFRLLWLGYDPIALGKIEIGSHLKHQRESSGFEEYLADLKSSVRLISRTLKSGRYAVLVIGDSLYQGKKYNTAEYLASAAKEIGFEKAEIILRELHKTKRSFTIAGRRATTENILVLRKKASPTIVSFSPPPYTLRDYERKLRIREGAEDKKTRARIKDITKSKSFVFTHHIVHANGFREPTWQAILENGMADSNQFRKDPKYVTHGLHPYKGKFYPQLAKSLMNVSGIPKGATILDPFCGSGTTLLEGYLNGYRVFGCDLHPLAAKIARAKTGILDENPDTLSEALVQVTEDLERHKYSSSHDQFDPNCREEIEKWFARPVALKINHLLRVIRKHSEGIVREFLETVLSSIIREVSQQDPTDLRIRYRKELLKDADVIGIFKKQLAVQFSRIEKFWKIRGYAPTRFFSAHVTCGDNRQDDTYVDLGIENASVDMVLSSPPYAMALPYIDTDRLSLLTLFGIHGSLRRPLEQVLIGSREINGSEKNILEQEIQANCGLPSPCLKFLHDISVAVSKSTDSGFRKKNMPALLFRFLRDMDTVYKKLAVVCKPGATIAIVIGDGKMSIDKREIRIPSTNFMKLLAQKNGLKFKESIGISVTTDNHIHTKNAIMKNAVLVFEK